MQSVARFMQAAASQDHPLRALEDFLAREEAYSKTKQYDLLRFVGYVLEIGYDEAVIITSDPFKLAVGGIPRGSMLVMVADDLTNLPPHCTLLRVAESAPTPLSTEVAQTYFELQKKSMPEIDVFTQGELQWGALRTTVLGMLYPDPDRKNTVEFSGDVNNFLSAHRYRLYSPDAPLLDLIVNALVAEDQRFQLGNLRMTECRLTSLVPSPAGTNGATVRLSHQTPVPVFVAAADFAGTRTAMFGKTRLGKSNVVKLLAENLILATAPALPGGKPGPLPPGSVGQLIFDQDGEYSNDNPQDGNYSLASAHAARCQVYALTPKVNTPSRPLKLNFYEQPDGSHPVLGSLLAADGKKGSAYVAAFMAAEIPAPSAVAAMPPGGDRNRAKHKVQLYWAILHRAGFKSDQKRLRAMTGIDFNPGFALDTRLTIHGLNPKATPKPIPPPAPSDLDGLVEELAAAAKINRATPLKSTSSSGGDLFDAEALALQEFLEPQPGRAGVSLLAPYRVYHDPQAGDFIKDILGLLDKGQTVLLDLGNANPEVMRYFSNALSEAVFGHQVAKFTTNALGMHYIQLYFEEAHNLFPRTDTDLSKTYARLAKEGAKYHIGMVYATQSPTTISKDLLKNTENFFVTHLSAQEDVKALAELNVAYEPVQDEILHARTPGYVRLLTRSHRFVVAAQARRFLATAQPPPESGAGGPADPGSPDESPWFGEPPEDDGPPPDWEDLFTPEDVYGLGDGESF